MVDETVGMVARRERDIDLRIDKILYSMISEMFSPCEDPRCKSCSGIRQEEEEKEQAENGFTKSPNIKT